MFTNRTGMVAFLILALAALASTSVVSESRETLRSAWVGNDYVDMRLVSSHATIPSDGDIDLALEIKLKEGWVTYWVMPGISGFPPKITAQELENVEQFEVMWPAPKRHTLTYSDAVGYSGHVFVPISMSVKDPAVAAHLSVDWQIAVCEDICVLLEEQFVLAIPPTPEGASALATADMATISDAKHQVPVRSATPGILGENFEVVSATVKPYQQGHRLDVVLTGRTKGKRTDVPEMYVAGPMAIRFGTPNAYRANSNAEVHYSFPVYLPDSKAALQGRDLTVVLVTPEGTYETEALVGAPVGGLPAMLSPQTAVAK